ncbi:MAG: AMP-binding protein [Treponema sp.]|jgi:long-chain acyl-CoA synthetase|nr:AMP-binding protein [Treponema sp.]
MNTSVRTVIELLRGAAREYGQRPYLGGKTGDEWIRYSYRDTDRLSDAFALSLISLGLERNENIAILSEGRPSWVIAEFGVLKAGCVSVPLSTKLQGEEIIFRLDHSESRVLLISENNFRKGAEILDKVKKRPVLVCLSPKNSRTEELCGKFSLAGGKDIFYYDELAAKGEEFLSAGGGEGPLLRGKLEEITGSIGPDDTVTISYTSGTTGNPKGIMLSHRNYLHNAFAAAAIVKVEEGWKSLIMLPLDHSFAHTVGIYIFLFRCLAMYFPDSQGGPLAAMRNLPSNLKEVNPDLLLTVPALSGNFMKKMIQGVAAKGKFINGIFERGVRAGIARAGNGFARPALPARVKNFFPWAAANALVFPSLRRFFGRDIKFCIGGGALLEIRQQEFFNAIGVPVYQGYGLTENAPIICSNSRERHKFGTSGVIIPGLDVRIMKDETAGCAVGEIGQIVTRGGSVMKGYYKNAEATAATVVDGWLWSGDLGFLDADGFLVVTGREKALLIAADGEKYSPETIEEAVINTSKFIDQIMVYNEQCKFTSALVTVDALELSAAVKAAGITGVSDGDMDHVIDILRDDLAAFRNTESGGAIPVQWRPASFAVIPEAFGEENGLVNSTMKLVRHKVRDFYRSRIDEIYAGPAADPHLPGNRDALRRVLE